MRSDASGRFRRDQSVADREAHQAWHVEDAEALHHLDPVALDRLDAEEEALGHLPGAQPFCDQLQDLPLPRRERVELGIPSSSAPL